MFYRVQSSGASETITKTVVVGDIHGQWHDLVRVLSSQRLTTSLRLLFMGDIVDRGDWSLECILMVLLLKLSGLVGECILLRGNHECPLINREYGFYVECLRRYGDVLGARVWSILNGVFQWLPLCASIDDKLFFCHGGISPRLFGMSTLEQLNEIDRSDLIINPDAGEVCDLTWADPDLECESATGFDESSRGCSYVFSEKVAGLFCKKFGFDMVCRAHQLVDNGFEFFANRQLVTVFSASNYCGDSGNSAAVMTVSGSLVLDFIVFPPLSATEVFQLPPTTATFLPQPPPYLQNDASASTSSLFRSNRSQSVPRIRMTTPLPPPPPGSSRIRPGSPMPQRRRRSQSNA